MADILEGEEQVAISERFMSIVSQSPSEVRDSLPKQLVSQLTFKLEAHVNENRPKVIHEEWEAKMRELNELLVKEQINKNKESLREAEQNGNDSESERLLREIDELKKRL